MKRGLIRLLALVLASGIASARPLPPSPAPGTTFRDCRDCPQMVVIGPGSFLMGADGGEPGRYEGPVRPITIGYKFAVGVIPVTYAQFRRFVDETGYKAAHDCWVPRNGTYVPVPGSGWRDPALGHSPRDDEPVVCIDWRDAKAYVDWLARKTGQPYRMMSEAEWEYVARAGSTTPFFWGSDPEQACVNANLLDASASASMVVSGTPTRCSDGYPGLSPAGAFPPNRFGVRDMVGNVWTWVADCYEVPYPKAPLDGRPYLGGSCDRRSVRGASWATTVPRARVTFRGRDPVDRVSQLFGLRVARDIR